MSRERGEVEKPPSWFTDFLDEAAEYAQLRAEYEAALNASDNPDGRYFFRDKRAAFEAAAMRAWKAFAEIPR